MARDGHDMILKLNRDLKTTDFSVILTVGREGVCVARCVILE